MEDMVGWLMDGDDIMDGDMEDLVGEDGVIID